MIGLKRYPDKFFDLAIVDPVYGDVTKGGYMTGQGGEHCAKRGDYHLGVWDQQKTGIDYFVELQRVSKNIIVWGGNYFADMLPSSQCWIVWDKRRAEGVTFADCELAYTSFNKASRIFRYKWDGMLQENMKNKEKRIQPCHKPIALYEWLINKFANEGDVILDTHVGGGSSLIACYNTNHKYVGFEIDETYYKQAKERIERETAQMNIWNFIGDRG